MVRRLTEQVKSLALQDVYGRMVRVLMELSDPAGSERVVREKLTQQDIADRVGSSREMVNRVMKDLTAGGYVVGARRPLRHPSQASGGPLRPPGAPGSGAGPGNPSPELPANPGAPAAAGPGRPCLDSASRSLKRVQCAERPQP